MLSFLKIKFVCSRSLVQRNRLIVNWSFIPFHFFEILFSHCLCNSWLLIIFYNIIIYPMLRIRIIYPESVQMYILWFSTLSFENFILDTEIFLRQKISYNSHTALIIVEAGLQWIFYCYVLIFFKCKKRVIMIRLVMVANIIIYAWKYRLPFQFWCFNW